MLKQRVAEVCPAIFIPFLLQKSPQFDITAMDSFDIGAPARPYPAVAVGRADIAFACVLIGDQIDAFDVLKCCPPIRAIVADQNRNLIE